MTEEQKQCLREAMMLLEIAFFGGNDNWKEEDIFRDIDEAEMAAYVHGLIQYVHHGYKNDDYELAKAMCALISSQIIIEDVMQMSRK